jgi:hypothetical protein
MVLLKQKIRAFPIIALLFLFSAAPAVAGQLTLAWDPNPEPNIAGYRVAYGVASGVYTATLDVGNVTTYTATNLTEGTRYYFVVYAYNASSQASPASGEVSGIVPCAVSGVLNQSAFSSAGGSGSVAVVGGTCSWTATSSAAWLSVTAGSSGSGNGTVNFSVAPSPLTNARVGVLTIGGQVATVTQAPLTFNGAAGNLIWQNDTTRQVALWSMGGTQGTTQLGFSWISSAGIPGWSIVGTADFNLDGRPDVIWQNDMTRQVAVWFMGGTQGTTMTGFAWLSQSSVPGWNIVGIGDFNGDGHPDVIWQNEATRQAIVWLLGGAQGVTLLGTSWISQGDVPGWTIVATGDFNVDGHPDVIWQNDVTRQVIGWLLGGAQGTTHLGSAWLTATGAPGWRIAGASDLDGDGHPDLVWQNDLTRQVIVWLLGGPQGNTMRSTSWVSQAGIPGWKVVAR